MNESRQVIINASAHSIPLPERFVHTVVTSPPYYSLRKYQGEQQIDWPEMAYSPMPGLEPLIISSMACALGLEPTPEAYIGHLVLCFREVKRVLREDGVAWVVMGDSYGHGTTATRKDGGPKQQTNTGANTNARHGGEPGDLMGIPHRLMFALQGDGWLVRNDVVWAKVAPMPESVSGWRWERCRVKVKPGRPPANQGHLPDNGQRPGGNRGNQWGDVQNQPNATYTPCPGCSKCSATGGYVLRRGSWRHTRAHETVLMCAKSMGYYADQERVREAATDSERFHGAYASGNPTQGDNGRNRANNVTSGRNPRSVMTPRPSSYPGAHYAVFSPDLIAPLLRATAPTRVCPVCGAPWAPVVEREKVHCSELGINVPGHNQGRGQRKTEAAMIGKDRDHWNDMTYLNRSELVGHRPTCDCANPDTDPWTELREYPVPIPGWVLDPFAGTFTTGAVCAELGVNCIGLDISPEYLDEHAKPRIGLTPSGALEDLPLFAELEL